MKIKLKEVFLSFRQKNRLTFYILCGVIFTLILFGLYKIGAMSIVGVKEKAKNGGPILTADWIKYEDPHGFSVSYPEDWQVKVESSGLVSVSKDGSTAVIWPIVVKNQDLKTAYSEVLEKLKSDWQEYKVISERQLDDKNSIIQAASYKVGDKNYKSLFLFSLEDKNGFLSGFYALENEFQVEKPNLVGIIYSFKYQPQLFDPNRAGVTLFTDFTDPTEGAFNLKVPLNWTTNGAVDRGYIDANLYIESKNQNKGVESYTLYPPLFTVPNAVLEFAGFTEGSNYNPSGFGRDMIIRSYGTAEEYINNYLVADLSLKYPGVNVVDIKERSDISSALSGKNPLITQISAAEGTLKEGEITHRVVVVTQLLQSGESGVWAVSLLHYWASDPELNLIEEIVNEMQASFKINIEWAQREAAEVFKRSQIISQTADEISNIITSAYRIQSESQDRLSEKWENAILGTNDVYDPNTGEQWELPNDSNYYWKNGYEIYGTESHEVPYNDPNMKELISVD